MSESTEVQRNNSYVTRKEHWRRQWKCHPWYRQQ